MTDLHCIVYTSSAVHSLDQDEIDHLLTRARERNEEEGVTGMLLYCECCFMQYIEGPRAGLMRIYDVILKDPLHHTIIELLNEPVQVREFEDWAMAYSRAQKAELKPLLETDWKTQQGMPIESRLSQGRQLLARFWHNQGRFLE